MELFFHLPYSGYGPINPLFIYLYWNIFIILTVACSQCILHGWFVLWQRGLFCGAVVGEVLVAAIFWESPIHESVYAVSYIHPDSIPVRSTKFELPIMYEVRILVESGHTMRNTIIMLPNTNQILIIEHKPKFLPSDRNSRFISHICFIFKLPRRKPIKYFIIIFGSVRVVVIGGVLAGAGYILWQVLFEVFIFIFVYVYVDIYIRIVIAYQILHGVGEEGAVNVVRVKLIFLYHVLCVLLELKYFYVWEYCVEDGW